MDGLAQPVIVAKPVETVDVLMKEEESKEETKEEPKEEAPKV